jgi:DNA-binding NarL/FixJ family response regulator
LVTATDLDHGRESYAGGSWRTAFEFLSRADRRERLGTDDLECLARSSYMLGRDEEYVDALVRAHQAHVEAGDVARGVRCAIWIGHSLLFRGLPAQADGWFARAERLLKRTPDDCVERGYILIPTWLAAMQSGDHEAGLATMVEAEQIGERFADADLVWLARDEQARALLKLGRVDQGLRLVGEILVAAQADELTPFITGIVYCNTIDFCRSCYELRHVREWTAALSRWCDRQPEMVAHNGLCLVHRAEVMQLMGSWADALTEAQRAAERFTDGALNQIALGSAHYRQGEIHRLRGDFDEAERAFREASRRGFVPQPGMALMRLSQGQGDAAAAAIRRCVAEATEPLARAALLAVYVEIMLAIGDSDAAHGAARDLGRIAAERSNDVLDAMAAKAEGELSLAEGNVDGALLALRRAITVWQTLDAPYEVAQIRVVIASACRAFGDDEAARLELDAAQAGFARLGAEPDLAGLAGGAPQARHGLSEREVEVLSLIAAGKGNREIAAALVISEHTVARHVQNIFAKLGVSTRTAAAAFAFEHKLR